MSRRTVRGRAYTRVAPGRERPVIISGPEREQKKLGSTVRKPPRPPAKLNANAQKLVDVCTDQWRPYALVASLSGLSTPVLAAAIREARHAKAIERRQRPGEKRTDPYAYDYRKVAAE